MIHGDVHKWGGVDATRRLAALCSVFGIGMNLHPGGELGISSACHLQVAAATPELTFDAYSMYPLLADDITEPLVLSGGARPVPDGPGLGLEVDQAKLKHYAERHVADGDLVW